MKAILNLLLIFTLSGCATQYPNQNIEGQAFPSVTGTSLEQQTVSLPAHVSGKASLYLIGYKQDSQFDIDRWLIGLDMKEVNVVAFELPTIAGMFPRMFSTQIDEGMRRGIPKELWRGVITIYEVGERIQAFTGNEKPNNARVVLLNRQGEVAYFYDRGFSVAALNELINRLAELG